MHALYPKRKCWLRSGVLSKMAELLKKLCYYCFLCTQKVISYLCKITVEPLMSHGLFYWSPCYISGPGNIAVALLSMESQRALGFHQKYLNLCSEDERRSSRFGTTWGWVINDRIFIFVWTNPLMLYFIILALFYFCTIHFFSSNILRSYIAGQVPYWCMY